MTREQGLETLRGLSFADQAKVEEYIREAEHQEGVEYWSMFATPDELIADFNLYIGD